MIYSQRGQVGLQRRLLKRDRVCVLLLPPISPATNLEPEVIEGTPGAMLDLEVTLRMEAMC